MHWSRICEDASIPPVSATVFMLHIAPVTSFPRVSRMVAAFTARYPADEAPADRDQRLGRGGGG